MRYAVISRADEPYLIGKPVRVADISECGKTCTIEEGSWKHPTTYTLNTADLSFISWEWYTTLGQVPPAPEYLAKLDEAPPEVLDIMRGHWDFQYDSGKATMWAVDPDGNDVWASIQFRPSHCEQGNYVLTVGGSESLENDDTFPRYFMNNNVAKQEAKEFLAWRLYKFDAHKRQNWI